MAKVSHLLGLHTAESAVDYIAPLEPRLFFALLKLSFALLALFASVYAVAADPSQGTAQALGVVIGISGAALVTLYVFSMAVGRILRTHGHF